MGTMIPPTGLTSGISATPRKQCGHRSFSGHSHKSPLNLCHWSLNLEVVSGRSSHDPGFAESLTGTLPRRGCQTKIKRSCSKDLQRWLPGSSQASEGQGGQRRVGAGREQHPPKALSPSHGLQQQGPEARGSAPKCLPSVLERNYSGTGHWQVWEPPPPPTKGLFNLMCGTKFKPKWTFVSPWWECMGCTKKTQFVKGKINYVFFAQPKCTMK